MYPSTCALSLRVRHPGETFLKEVRKETVAQGFFSAYSVRTISVLCFRPPYSAVWPSWVMIYRLMHMLTMNPHIIG